MQKGSVCREHLAGLGSSLAAGTTSVRSALGYSGENPGNRPDRCVTLHFCCVTERLGNDAEFKTACVKNLPLVKN